MLDSRAGRAFAIVSRSGISSAGRQDSRILLRARLVVEVDHIGLVVEGHRIVLPEGEGLQGNRLELDRQPVVCLRAVCAYHHQFMLPREQAGYGGAGCATYTHIAFDCQRK